MIFLSLSLSRCVRAAATVRCVLSWHSSRLSYRGIYTHTHTSDNLLIVEVKANAFRQSAHHLIRLADIRQYIYIYSPSSSDFPIRHFPRCQSYHVHDANLSKWSLSILCLLMAIFVIQSSYLSSDWEIPFITESSDYTLLHRWYSCWLQNIDQQWSRRVSTKDSHRFDPTLVSVSFSQPLSTRTLPIRLE